LTWIYRSVRAKPRWKTEDAAFYGNEFPEPVWNGQIFREIIRSRDRRFPQMGPDRAVC
jgi:hypothetical protein